MPEPFVELTRNDRGTCEALRFDRIGRTCHVPPYDKLRSLTVQPKHQPLRRL